jgi:peptide/nickel transport system substrate-binding protein
VWVNLTCADGDALRTTYSTAGTNNYRIDDPDLEQLLQEQLALPDVGARNAVLGEIQQRIVGEAHSLPVFEYSIPIATDGTVHGFAQGADSRLDQLADVWIESGSD